MECTAVDLCDTADSVSQQVDSVIENPEDEERTRSLPVAADDVAQTEMQQLEEEDDDNYEITDFSMVTPWERLIFDVEEVLRKWGLAHGELGSGWDGAYPATRDHTILNSSGTKGVRHRRMSVTYLGRPLVLRHVVWLPEGIDVLTQGYCGVESIWRKRSSAATRRARVKGEGVRVIRRDKETDGEKEGVREQKMNGQKQKHRGGARTRGHKGRATEGEESSRDINSCVREQNSVYHVCMNHVHQLRCCLGL